MPQELVSYCADNLIPISFHLKPAGMKARNSFNLRDEKRKKRKLRETQTLCKTRDVVFDDCYTWALHIVFIAHLFRFNRRRPH